MAATTAESPADTYRYIIEDREFPTVRTWKAETGGKAVGHFPVYTPVELIHSVGLLPVGVYGGGNEIELAHADSRFQSFVCSIVKSTMELAMTNRLDLFAGMIFNSICDPARNLASVVKRNTPDLQVDFIHYTQNPGSPSALSYMEEEYRRVWQNVAGWVGKSASEDDLAASIHSYDRVRALLRELYALRAASPEKVSAVDSYVLTRATTMLPPERSIDVLTGALRSYRAAEAKAQDRVRVVLIGAFCEQPPLDLIDSIERAGCYLLDDDFLLGTRLLQDDVAVEGKPALQALASSYLDHSLHSSVKHDLRMPRALKLINKVKDVKADAV
ncbi:MAG: 2-hydroxyacyl-CoA dehydratase, partial [Chloroflexota bacterium]|nr:2-hydroxyacyl-CoA dehydratase [Chloroflexota bacterium]